MCICVCLKADMETFELKAAVIIIVIIIISEDNQELGLV